MALNVLQAAARDQDQRLHPIRVTAIVMRQRFVVWEAQTLRRVWSSNRHRCHGIHPLPKEVCDGGDESTHYAVLSGLGGL